MDEPTPQERLGGRGRTAEAPPSGTGWTFFTNHGHVLLALARDPYRRLREVAEVVGITERAVQAIVADLEAEGYLTRTRVGRRNAYRFHPERRLRHPAESDHAIGELLELFVPPDGPSPS